MDTKRVPYVDWLAHSKELHWLTQNVEGPFQRLAEKSKDFAALIWKRVMNNRK